VVVAVEAQALTQMIELVALVEVEFLLRDTQAQLKKQLVEL
jgi:hypothetical protein